MDRKIALSKLELEGSPTEDEIRRAYKKMVLKCHPDKGGTEDQFHEINLAMDALLNPASIDGVNASGVEIERQWHKYVHGEVDLGHLLKKYFTPEFVIRKELLAAITISDYHHKVPVNVEGYGKFTFEHLGENYVDEYIITPYLIDDDDFQVAQNLDIAQNVECSLSTLLFGGELTYLDLSGKKMKAGPIKGSKKIMDRKITIKGRGLKSENRVGDMILKLSPNFDNTDFQKVVENKKLLMEIFK